MLSKQKRYKQKFTIGHDATERIRNIQDVIQLLTDNIDETDD